MDTSRRLGWILFILIFGLTFADTSWAKRKVIIDQDAFGPGGSNLQAILLVLQSPDVEVLGITIESGDGWQDENVAHTLRMLELVGRPEIPVLRGAVFPLVNTAAATKLWERRYGKLVYKGAWTEDFITGSGVDRPIRHEPLVVPALTEGSTQLKPSVETAADFLVRSVRAYPGEVTILALGPMTNLALAARLDETFARKTKELIFMGGSYSPKPANNDFALEYLQTPRLEFNFRWDPEAMHIVLHEAWPRIIQIPVDPTTPTLFSKAVVARISAHTLVADYVRKYAEPFPMWDELAVAAWLAPEIITQQTVLAVDVDTDGGAGYGNTLSWTAGHGPQLGERDVTVVFSVDVAKLESWCVAAFNR